MQTQLPHLLSSTIIVWSVVILVGNYIAQSHSLYGSWLELPLYYAFRFLNAWYFPYFYMSFKFVCYFRNRNNIMETKLSEDLNTSKTDIQQYPTPEQQRDIIKKVENDKTTLLLLCLQVMVPSVESARELRWPGNLRFGECDHPTARRYGNPRADPQGDVQGPGTCCSCRSK